MATHPTSKFKVFGLGLAVALLFPATALKALSYDNIEKYPGAKTLCSQHNTAVSQGKPKHILFRIETSSAEQAPIVEFYEKKLGMKPKSAGSATDFSDPANPGLIVTVYPKERAASFPSCDTAPPADARSMILISQMIAK